MNFFRCAALVAIISCAISLPAAAQIPSNDTDTGAPGIGLGAGMGAGVGRRVRYVVSGTVREAESDRPLDFVSVKLWTLSAGGSAVTTTGSNGNFSFTDVPSGNYYLVVEEKGYQRVQEEVVLRGNQPMGIQLTLKRDTPYAPKVGTGATVSTRELAIPRRAYEAMTRGLSLANEKSDYKGSIAQYQRAVKEYPDYYEAYTQMGIAYLKMGDAAKSEEMLRKSIDMSQRKYPDALFTLAFVYSSQKRFADAEPLARQALQLDPGSWDANLELARALHGQDRSAEAEPLALEALRMRPDQAQIHLILANIHLKTRNFTALINDLDNYLQLSPKGPEADQARVMRAQVAAAIANAQSGTP